MNMLKQRRDYFQFGGKAEFNLKLTVIFTAGFSRILEVLNLGIKSESMGAPGRRATCHLSDFPETWPV